MSWKSGRTSNLPGAERLKYLNRRTKSKAALLMGVHLLKVSIVTFAVGQVLIFSMLTNAQVVITDLGKVKGQTTDRVTSSKGIPFAAPPVGDLRWRPPQPAVGWKGVRDATQYGHDCMQKPFPSDAAPLG